MDIVIFGTGAFYQKRKFTIDCRFRIIAFIDNNINIQGKNLDNVEIYSPKDIDKLEYDKIIIASVSENEMRSQLEFLGVDKNKILTWNDFVNKYCRGDIFKYGEAWYKNKLHSYLFILPMIDFAGGTLAAANAAQALNDLENGVVMVAPYGDMAAIEEIVGKGIDVWLCPVFPFISSDELKWISSFEYIICNSLQTIVCATQIDKGKNLLFWLHEYSNQYNVVLNKYHMFCDMSNLESINICTVSKKGRSIFQKYLSCDKVGLLPFGIHDSYCDNIKQESDEIVIAIIGAIVPFKNQLGFVNAIKSLPQYIQKKIRCKIIGRIIDKKYYSEVIEAIDGISCIEILGEKKQSEVRELLAGVDVIVCTSVEETMSMTIVEGMMASKVCLTNTNTGIADYIENGTNGFVYEAGNQKDFCNQIQYIIEHYSELEYIRENARKTYLSSFSLEAVKKHIKEVFNIF